jgi:hypothetical protein
MGATAEDYVLSPESETYLLAVCSKCGDTIRGHGEGCGSKRLV